MAEASTQGANLHIKSPWSQSLEVSGFAPAAIQLLVTASIEPVLSWKSVETYVHIKLVQKT